MRDGGAQCSALNIIAGAGGYGLFSVSKWRSSEKACNVD
jgi:hypothetical protein